MSRLLTMTNATKANVIAAINAIFGLLVVFHVGITDAQIGAIDIAANAVLALLVGATFTQSAKRVNAGVTPGAVAVQISTAATSGTNAGNSTVRVYERVTKVILEAPGAGRLGRHVDHDPRSRRYPIAVATPTALKKVLWGRAGIALNQGDLGSCTGNALAGVLNTAPFRRKGAKLLTEKDAVAIYQAATVIDGFPGQYPPDDTGSSGLAVCKAAKARGLIAGYTHAFGIADALRALQTGPVITGVNWYDGFDRPDANGLVRISGQVRGGHEFEVLGYDPATDLVTAENSWGPGWGVKGRFHFTSSTWAQLLAEQGDVTVPVPLA